MKTYKPEELRERNLIKSPVHLAIGMFDGLHLGHQSVIHSAVQAAELDGGLSGILTFDPHPSRLFRPDSPTPQIYTPAAKQELLREMDLALCLIQPFGEKFAAQTALEFVEWICGCLPTLSSISVGENFRFGKNRQGAPSLLVDQLRSRGISVFSCERVHLDGEPISSTRIRGILPTKPIEEVNRLLGRPYHSIGKVEEGKRLGRTLGFPTLNLPFDAEIAPLYGVYLVRYRRLGDPRESSRFGVANFGLRPTVEDTPYPRLEVHSLDPCIADYGDPVVVEWIQFLREEKNFANIRELESAIAKDRKTALSLIHRVEK